MKTILTRIPSSNQRVIADNTNMRGGMSPNLNAGGTASWGDGELGMKLTGERIEAFSGFTRQALSRH
jgi:hypothetical protein